MYREVQNDRHVSPVPHAYKNEVNGTRFSVTANGVLQSVMIKRRDFSGVPMTRITVFWVSILRTPYFGKLQNFRV